MALDGVFVKALSEELNTRLADTRLYKIRQTEKDEVLLTFKGPSVTEHVLLSANASLPFVRLTEETKEALPSAPVFCMVLRKHLENGRLLSVTSPGLERVLEFRIEHLNEMGDMETLRLVAELMGKHSNLILVDEGGTILDAVRRVTPVMSSLRSVLPGLPYFLPEMQKKKDPLTETREGFLSSLSESGTVLKAFTEHYAGLSEPTVHEYLFAAGIDPDRSPESLTEAEKAAAAEVFLKRTEDIRSGRFSPEAASKSGMPVQFSASGLPSYKSRPDLYTVTSYDSPSELLGRYYGEKVRETRIREKSAELKKTLKTLTERTARKKDLQEAKLRDTAGRDRHRLFGELLSAFSYSLPVGEKTVQAENYYDDNKLVTIPVDPDLSIADNAKRYFEKYTREKRTFEAVSKQLAETEDELQELVGLSYSLGIAENEEDLREIRQELFEAGFLKKTSAAKNPKKQKKSEPYHYLTRDGFHVYVGKNNLQNEALTFRFASGNDYFFHAKKTPGSHVILKTEGKPVPDRAFEDAAALAAYYSTARQNGLVEVDYVHKKEVKKVPGKQPGFVIYDTNYSMMAAPTTEGLTLLS